MEEKVSPRPYATPGGKEPSRPAVQSARFALRERTHNQHVATEGAFSDYDLTRVDHYRAFLTAQAMVFLGFELAVTGHGWNEFEPRLPQLADDLAALGTWLPAPMIAPYATGPAAWGVQYVLEGSRLGGRMLCKSLPAGVPARFLTPPADLSARWRRFGEALDAAASTGGAGFVNEASEAAIDAFQQFRRAARAMAEELA